MISTGAEIDKEIMKWLEEHQAVKGYHHPDSRRATISGWPDWVFLGEAGVIFREIKGRNDTLSYQQRQIGRLLQVNGFDWRVWYRRDIMSGLAWQELEEIARTPEDVSDEAAAIIAGYPDIR